MFLEGVFKKNSGPCEIKSINHKIISLLWYIPFLLGKISTRKEKINFKNPFLLGGGAAFPHFHPHPLNEYTIANPFRVLFNLVKVHKPSKSQKKTFIDSKLLSLLYFYFTLLLTKNFRDQISLELKSCVLVSWDFLCGYLWTHWFHLLNVIMHFFNSINLLTLIRKVLIAKY